MNLLIGGSLGNGDVSLTVAAKEVTESNAPVGAALIAQAMDRREGAGRYKGMQSIMDWDRSRLAYRAVKRTFDIVFSGAVLAVIAIPSLALAALIRLESEGSPFYSQIRVGRTRPDGSLTTFRMWKFRSMRVVRGASEASLRPEQDRIFWWGKIMRRLKIDELPQLLNILNGTMSIVGPRPAAVDQIEITRGGENAIAATVPCGLTSQSSLWDYIYGDQFTEEEEYNEKVLPIRLKLDVYYVKHASFWWDICLIWWTVLSILYTTCGKYPQWLHDKLVEYSKTV